MRESTGYGSDKAHGRRSDRREACAGRIGPRGGRRLSRSNRRGYLLVEASVVLLVLPALFFGIYMTIDRATNALRAGTTLSELQEEARKILDRVVSELRGTGITPTSDGNFPAIYEWDPVTGMQGNFVAMMNLASMPEMPSGFAAGSLALNKTITNATVPSQVIQYKLPQDLDGDGSITNGITGRIEWSPSVYSIAAEKQPNGLYQLNRYVNGVVDQFLGKDVQRIVFDVTATDVSVPTNEIFVTLFLARVAAGGHLLRVGIEGSVEVRNRSRMSG